MKNIFFLLTAICFSKTLCAQNGNQAEVLYAIGQQRYDEGKYQTAADSLEKALVLFESRHNMQGRVKALNLMGECKANLSQCDQSLEILDRALKLALANFKPLSSEVAYTYYYLARSMGGCARKHHEAITLMHKSINLKRQLYGEGIEVAFDYTYMGYMFNNLTHYDSSLYYLEKAMRIREKELSPDDVETANTLYHLGRTYENKSELGKALDLFLQSLKIRTAKLDPMHASLSNSLHQVGSIYQKLGNFDRALDYYQKALDIRIKSLGEGHANVAASYLTIGNLHGSLFNYRQAIQYTQQGNSIYEKIYHDKHDVLATYYAYLGSMYGHLGEHRSALTYFKKAQAQAEKNLTSQNQNLAVVYTIIGDYHASNNSFQEASEYFKKAIIIFRKVLGTHSAKEAEVVAKMGTIHAKNKNFTEAFKNYELALSVFLSKIGKQNPKVASVYQLMGDAYNDQHQFEKSLLNYQKAFVSMSPVFSDTLNLFLNPTPGQLDNKPLALRVASKKAEVLAQLAKQNGDVNYQKQSLLTYFFAIGLMDDITSGYNLESARIEFEKESRTVYDNAITTAHQLYTKTKDRSFIQDAFQISEKSKSVLLLENIRDTQAKSLAGVPDSLIEQERDIKIELTYYQRVLHEAMNKGDTTRIASQEKNIFKKQQEYDQLKSRLKKNFPSYFNFKYTTTLASLEKIRQSLPTETTLIEFYVADSALYKFTVSKKNTDLEKISNRTLLTKRMNEYERSLTDTDFILNARDEADQLYTSTAYALYEILLKSSLEEKTSLSKLVIIPDGRLAQFSFGSLISSQAQGKNPVYKQLTYLSNQFQISYAYSSSLITENSIAGKNPKNLFAGFAPSYSGNQFAHLDTLKHPMTYLAMRSGNLPLPGAAEEVKLISQFMKGDSFLNTEATETNFKLNAANYDILHLAMHSLLNNEYPNDSELLFNHENDRQNDGYLNVDEIYNLKLDASLVVLSACSSGFGKIQQGEGPISIARAFSYAGCPSVVMSLWKIPDEVTSAIMKDFYRELKNGKQKDEALRLAQLKFLNETGDPLYHHPYFWSGLVVMGNTDPLPKEFPMWIVYGGIALAVVIIFLARRKF
jgi:CHAT domain-containing protein